MPHLLKTLILYTRFPLPGTTKTRLAPALGPHGAAGLHRRLTEQTLHQADAFCLRHGATLEIHFDGGDEESMRQWLGAYTFRPQAHGSLGCRMAQSFHQAFRAGATQAVIIGTDCPGLTVGIMAQAFASLRARDLVLGPAVDGGYYLIGLTEPRPSLFADIDWGTPSVLKQTLAKAHSLTISQLAPLHDIDTPQDLAHFDYHPDPE